MADIVITREAYSQALDDIVEEHGRDFVYEDEFGNRGGQCMYVHTRNPPSPEPGCLHGQVLARLGVSLDQLADYEGTGIYSVLLDGLAVEDDELAYAAEDSQGKQDSGENWGTAQDIFHRVLSTGIRG